MAALAVTAAEKEFARNNRAPVGKDIEVTVRAGPTGTNAVDEFVQASDIGLKTITKIIGVVAITAAGTGEAGALIITRPNAAGTDATADATQGAVGVRTSVPVDLVSVTVRGKL